MKAYKSAKVKRENRIIWTVAIVAILLVTNFTIINFFLMRNYTYSNYNGTFIHYEERLMGKPYEGRDNRYRAFLEKNPHIKDKQLYRRFKLNPWRFWEWREWFAHFDRFMLPYISEEEVIKNRKAEGLNTVKKKRELPPEKVIPEKKVPEQQDSISN